MEELLKQRLESLLNERNKYILDAQKVVYGFDVAIGEVQYLIQKLNEPKPEIPVIGEKIENITP